MSRLRRAPTWIACLVLGVLAAAPPGLAQRRSQQGDPDAPNSFKELRERVHAERKLPARQRTKSIRYFMKFRTAQARAYLLRMVDSEDDTTVLNAVLGQLRYHNHASVLAALTGVLKDKRYQKNTTVLKAAAYSLATQKPAGIKLLIQELKKPRSDQRLEAAVHGLRFVKEPGVLPLLQQVFRQKRYEGDVSMLNSLGYALAQHGKDGFEFLLAEFQKPRSENHRKAALYGLRYVKDKAAAFAAVRRAFDKAEPEQKLGILQALTAHKDNPELTKLLLKLLESKDAQLRSEALYQLAMAGHPRTRQAAVQLAKETDALQKLPLERAKVAYVLMRVMQGNDIMLILKLAEGADRYLKSRISSLRSDKDKKLYPRFVKHLAEAATGNGPETLRYTAVRLLALCPDKESSRALLACLRGGSPRITATAMQTLVRRKDKRVVSHLNQVLAGDNVNLKLEAMLGLHEFRKSSKSSSAWARRLMQLVREGEAVTGLAAIELLAELRHRPALPLVQPMLSHEKWQVRTVAYSFCRQVRDISSVPLLIARLEHETGRLRHECLLALRNLTHLTYRQPEQWLQWWESSKDTFKLPRAPLAKRGKAGRPVAAAMTYYSIPLVSNRVCFIVDTSGSMAQKVGTAKFTKLKAAKQALRGVI
ncbi:MAG: HEAT repeat domain-containing protein, partial [Planctomycetota bacterium]